MPEIEDVPHVSPNRANQPHPPPTQSSPECIEGADVVDHPSSSTHVDQPPPPPPQSSPDCIEGANVVDHPSSSTHVDQTLPPPPELSSTEIDDPVVDHPSPSIAEYPGTTFVLLDI